MSNGNGAEGRPTIGAMIDGGIDRFLSLAQRNRRGNVSEREPKAPPTPSQARAASLEVWLREAPAEIFIVWLDELAATASAAAHASTRDHSEVVRFMGQEEGLRYLLDEVIRIRG